MIQRGRLKQSCSLRWQFSWPPQSPRALQAPIPTAPQPPTQIKHGFSFPSFFICKNSHRLLFPALCLLSDTSISGRNGSLEQAREEWWLLWGTGGCSPCTQSLPADCLHRQGADSIPSSSAFSWECKHSHPLFLKENYLAGTAPTPRDLSAAHGERRTEKVTLQMWLPPHLQHTGLSQGGASGPDPDTGCWSSIPLPRTLHIPRAWQPLKRDKRALWANRCLWGQTDAESLCPWPRQQPPSSRKAGSQGRTWGGNSPGWTWNACGHLWWGMGLHTPLCQHQSSFSTWQVKHYHLFWAHLFMLTLTLPLVFTPKLDNVLTTYWFLFLFLKETQIYCFEFFQKSLIRVLFSKLWLLSV